MNGSDKHYSFDYAGPPLMKLPAFLASTGYKNPEDRSNGPFQYGHNTKLLSWAFMKQHPEIKKVFNNHMAGYRQGRPSWMDYDFYPVVERLARGFKKDRPLLI